MNLRRLSEVGFIEALVRDHPRVFPRPPAGPGDDAATVGRLLVTTDAMLEDVHFRSSEPPLLLGRKALAVNLSDIAAMGGEPRAFVACLGIPSDTPAKFLRGLIDGLAAAAAERRVAWVGGDTVLSRRGVVIAITVIGDRGRTLLTRSGARPGDAVYVTGPLGGSAVGRTLLESGVTLTGSGRAKSLRARFTESLMIQAAELLRAHLDPSPRLASGAFLSRTGAASSAMDLSDGLSLDLARLCRSSRVGALIQAEAIPISQATRAWARRRRRDPLDFALNGGEDYELLFTVPPPKAKLLDRWAGDEGTGPFLIGRIRPRRDGIRIARPDGRSTPLRPLGYDAFRRSRRVDTP